MTSPDANKAQPVAPKLSRRAFVAGLAALPAGCAPPPGALNGGGPSFSTASSMYGAMRDGEYELEPINVAARDPDLLRQEVAFNRPYRPGTIVVSIPQRRLYLVQPGGRAIRYAVGVGRAEALNFRGSATIGRKAEWPHWTPTANMMRAIPKYREFAGGMPGGVDNPLGARALYLYRGSVDSNYRLHGTTEPESIGTAVSSGCIRLVNQDIIDLYNRVSVGTQVVVLQA